MRQGSLDVPTTICLHCNKNETTQDDHYCLECYIKGMQLHWEGSIKEMTEK